MCDSQVVVGACFSSHHQHTVISVERRGEGGRWGSVMSSAGPAILATTRVQGWTIFNTEKYFIFCTNEHLDEEKRILYWSSYNCQQLLISVSLNVIRVKGSYKTCLLALTQAAQQRYRNKLHLPQQLLHAPLHSLTCHAKLFAILATQKYLTEYYQYWGTRLSLYS